MDLEELRDYLNSMLTVSPIDFPLETNAKIGKIIEYEYKNVQITKWDEIPKSSNLWNVGIWKGDITTLKIDAIVNAANKFLLGCFTPNHKCIDNAIHCRAGPLLREECRRMVDKMGTTEDTGKAKITLAYNLPSRYVIHTVGPIIDGPLQPVELGNCYLECLNLAKASGLRSVAFCCISTGIFGYPQENAAHVALKTVAEWLAEEKNKNCMDLVLFNAFLDSDEEIYRRLLPEYFPK
eukprot:Phypoly_transcript_16006.p1 GENE.Phypoly_transcript_16006~~Phypoly_transcript_16006.p1  ORF type:complete len:251 (+),score=33.85 Phypoly_transcript_16006:45-755(+)